MNPAITWCIADSAPLRERLTQLALPATLFADHWQSGAEPAESVQAVLEWQDDHIQLRPLAKELGNPIAVDFLHGKTGFRAQRFAHEMIVKAVAGRSREPLTVVDATAGLGRDGFLLAAAGFSVTLMERHPAIATLLADGLYRAAQDADMAPVCARLRLQVGASHDLLQQIPPAQRPDVIYLDPMFPERQKTALVKKEMRIFRDVVGEDDDATALLELALQRARKRVVVKRPRKADTIGSRKPGHQLTGTSSRFDVYTVG